MGANGVAGAAGVAAVTANPALAWFAAASPLLGKVLDQPAAGPSRAESSSYASFDNSGFVVDFGPGSATAAGALSRWWIAVAALGAVGLIVWLKKN